MSNCGCSSSSDDCASSACSDFTGLTLPDFSCSPQTQKGALKRYAMVEVRQNGSSTDSATATTSSGGASAINVQCPTNAAPFWSYTTDEVVTLPAQGGFFQFKVCDASLWKTGMWVQHPLGKFPITTVDTVLNLLTVRNSCADNSAIPNNGDPGDTYSGPAVITPAESACDRREEVDEQVQDYLNETSEICNPNIPDLTGNERMNLLGGLAECVDTCSGQTSPGTKCQRFAPQVFADTETLQLPAAPERVMGSRTFNGLSAPIQLLGLDPIAGQVVRLDIPSDGDYLLSVSSGVMTFAPQGASQLIYTTPKTVASGSGASAAKDLNTISGVSVPSWATHAILECRAGIYSLGAQKLGNNISSAYVSVNGRNVAKVGSDQPWGSTAYSMDPSATDTNTIIAKLDGTSIAYAIAQNTDSGRTPIFECYIKVVGFTKAVIEP